MSIHIVSMKLKYRNLLICCVIKDSFAWRYAPVFAWRTSNRRLGCLIQGEVDRE